MKELYEILDVNKDGFISLEDWKFHFPENIVCGALQGIKDVIHANKLKSEDVINRLGIKDNQLFVDFCQLATGITQMDFEQDQDKAEKIALELLNGKKKIAVKELCEILECVEDETLN